MAAPTNVRTYATGQGQTAIKWTYTGGSDVKVYRSTDGASYSSIATVSPGTTGSYSDSGLLDKTKYWYKLTDDNGATFSSVVTVVTMVVSSRRATKSGYYPNQDYTSATQDINEALNSQQQNDPCPLCLLDGALVIDCTSGCEWFRVVLDQDVNSISLIGCDGCPNVDFIIPPNEQYGICGWPMGCDFLTDECFNGPIPGGTNGRTARTNGLSYDGYGPKPNNPGACCPAGTLTLSIQCCSDDCTLTCA